MLTIRPEQMAALDAYALDRFVRQQCGNLRRQFSERCEGFTQERLDALVRQGVDVAESFEIEDEADVARFLEHYLFLGANFESDPRSAWALTILRDADIAGTDKVNRLDDYVLFDLGGWPT